MANTGVVTEHSGRRVVISTAPSGLAVGDVVSVTINAQAPTQEVSEAIRVLLAVRPMGRAEITRALRRFKSADLVEAIDRLEASGVVQSVTHTTRGRPATIIRLTNTEPTNV
jgi:predicted ArsR family transcriptional regulator